MNEALQSQNREPRQVRRVAARNHFYLDFRRMSMASRYRSCLLTVAALSVVSCGDQATLTENDGTGANPKLPQPKSAMIPTVNIAVAKGWPAGKMPVPATGLAVAPFAANLDHPRWLYTLPNGDVLVAESNAPTRPADNPGLRNYVMGLVKARAGAGVKSANRITLLRDSKGTGVADTRTAFLTGLNSPFGMALIGNDLYVANTDGIVKFPYQEGQTEIKAGAVKVSDLPAGAINHHWTKNILASQDGKFLYATVGSNSNVSENGIENETDRAAILEVNIATGEKRVFASGLRNPNGLAWEPTSKALWTTVNERDELGSDLVPDYMTSVKDGGFYGWPYSYYGQNVDTRPKPSKPDLVSKAIVPDYALGPHTASLGLAFNTASSLPAHYNGGAFIGQHGSWNRVPRSGYKVVFVPFSSGRPSGGIEDVLTGFLNADGEAQGRPVGVAFDKKGALLVADDVGNVVWRVSGAQSKSAEIQVK
jgi:glucose/arabinose dehydrogenase